MIRKFGDLRGDAELREKTDRLAVALMDLGIKPLDRVLLQLPNWHEFIVSYFALQKIGAIPVILIARYRQYEVNHLAKLMKVDENEIKEWAETLENWGIIEIHYPLFGKPVLTMARKKPKKEEEEDE